MSSGKKSKRRRLQRLVDRADASGRTPPAYVHWIVAAKRSWRQPGREATSLPCGGLHPDSGRAGGGCGEHAHGARHRAGDELGDGPHRCPTAPIGNEILVIEHPGEHPEPGDGATPGDRAPPWNDPAAGRPDESGQPDQYCPRHRIFFSPSRRCCSNHLTISPLARVKSAPSNRCPAPSIQRVETVSSLVRHVSSSRACRQPSVMTS